MRRRFQLPNGDTLAIVLRDHRSSPRSKDEAHGQFVVEDGRTMGFFRVGAELYFFIDVLADLPAAFTLENKNEESKRRFTITHSGSTVFERCYPAETDYDVNPFWPTEEEDVDPLLWLTNIMNSPERTEVIIENHQTPTKA